MMELPSCDISTPCHDQISLGDILQVQNQPVSEEQAWALCFQLCSLLSRRLSNHDTWTRVVLPAADGVLFSRDGNISLRVTDTGTHVVMDTEEQAVEFVGRLVYSCLDWGLETHIERELNERLEILVCQMTKVNLSQCNSKPLCTISDVIQACKHRLYDPSQAVSHYKNVCSTLFLHTVELCHYMQIVQQSRKNLQKLLIDSEPNLMAKMTTNLVSGWNDLVDELSRGVVLQPLAKCVNVTRYPLPVETTPSEQLLLDIQCRRYKLRKVQTVNVNGQRKPDPHQTLLELIRSRPTLRPASERKIGMKPKEQTCLHELLMQEIRSTNNWKRLANNRPLPLQSMSVNGENEATYHLKPNQQLKQWDDALHQQDFTGLNICAKRRTRSFASNRDLFKSVKGSKKGAVLTTIVDVKKMHSSYKGDVKNMMCERYRDWRACSCCTSKSLYFTWHNICFLCSGVVCPACCVEMCLPSKRCVNLPLSFFKQIVMDGEQSHRNFWTERWSWDSSWIPLVLMSCGPNSTSVHSLAMRDWYSQDICLSCQTLLLETCDSVLPSCPIKDSQEI